MDVLFVLNHLVDFLHCVRGKHLEGDGSASQRLGENLHVAATGKSCGNSELQARENLAALAAAEFK
jgi:hypothetical protein